MHNTLMSQQKNPPLTNIVAKGGFILNYLTASSTASSTSLVITPSIPKTIKA